MIFYKAQRVFLSGNGHFLQDRPHLFFVSWPSIPLNKIDQWAISKEEVARYQSFAEELGGIWDLHAPGRPAGPAEVRA